MMSAYTEGEFAGWYGWDDDPFEHVNGPFAFREREDGEIECAVRVREAHCNGHGAAHGGFLMSFADFCLFAIGRKALGGAGVTVSCTSQFLGPAWPGERLSGFGRITRAGGKLVFLEIMLSVEDRPVLSVSGIIRRVRRDPPEAG